MYSKKYVQYTKCFFYFKLQIFNFIRFASSSLFEIKFHKYLVTTFTVNSFYKSIFFETHKIRENQFFISFYFVFFWANEIKKNFKRFKKKHEIDIYESLLLLYKLSIIISKNYNCIYLQAIFISVSFFIAFYKNNECTSKFRRDTANENEQFRKTKTLICYAYLIRQIFQE